jgi:hypothetical protein
VSSPPRLAPARTGTVLLLGIATAAIGWILLDAWAGFGRNPLPLPWTAVAGTVALAVAVVAAGLPVRRWVNGGRTQAMDPLVAARTAVLAKAAAYGGALLAGWYVAQAVSVLPDVVGVRRTRLILALLAVVAAAAVSAAGLLVQRWCRVPPTDDEDDPA